MTQATIRACPTVQVKDFQDEFVANLFEMADVVPTQINVDEATRQQIRAAIMHGIARAARQSQAAWREIYSFDATTN